MRRVATPFDRTRAHGAGPAFVLLSAAAPLVPAGASVEVRSSDPAGSAYAYQLAVGMLPGRAVLEGRGEAGSTGSQYVLWLGARGGPAAGRVLLETGQGALVKRSP